MIQNIIVGVIGVAVLATIIWRLFRKKRNRSSCGCAIKDDCSSCNRK